MKYRMKWYWKAGIPLMVLLLSMGFVLFWGGGGGPGVVETVYYRFTPMVVNESFPTDVVLEVKVEGSPTEVTIALESTGSEALLNDNGSGGDMVAGDGIYTITLGATDVLHDFTPDDVNRNFVGYLHLYAGGALQEQYNIFIDILTTDIPPVEINIVSSDIQYTEHLVNIVDPSFFSSFSRESITHIFYSHFDDNYDFINIIYEIPHIQNRFHADAQNNVEGIGRPLFDSTATYWSDGRLLGFLVFPIPTMFDGAAPAYSHEFGHQWINFLPVPPLDYAIPHWPLSDLASGVMGWATGPGAQGFTFNYDLASLGGGDYQLVPNNSPKVFTDLSLYLMGFIPASDVSNHFVFDDKNQPLSAFGTLHGPVTSFSIGDIISAVGPRVPDYTQAQKKFRVATILVSRDGLLSEDAMRLYDYFSARAEETEVVPYSDGFEKGESNPFYLATQEIGQLDTRIKRHILVDASRDGGVWWFPQTEPFDPGAYHQGKNLADYLRSLGHTVDELPRPCTITAELLADYDIVIRAAGFGNYDPAEITAYLDYVQNGGNLLLLADHGPPDDLAMSFGIQFDGISRGENIMTNYTLHPITEGVGDLFYNVGGGLISYPSTAEILGTLSALSYLDLNENGIQDPGEPSGPPVLGILVYGKGRIIFCGDTNLWETVPLPLIDNVLQWLADP